MVLAFLYIIYDRLNIYTASNMYTYIQLCLCRSIDRYDADPGVQGTFLLQMSNEITIHQKHLHALICEVFKSLNNSNPEFMFTEFIVFFRI